MSLPRKDWDYKQVVIYVHAGDPNFSSSNLHWAISLATTYCFLNRDLSQNICTEHSQFLEHSDPRAMKAWLALHFLTDLPRCFTLHFDLNYISIVPSAPPFHFHLNTLLSNFCLLHLLCIYAPLSHTHTFALGCTSTGNALCMVSISCSVCLQGLAQLWASYLCVLPLTICFLSPGLIVIKIISSSPDPDANHSRLLYVIYHFVFCLFNL